MHRGFLLFFLLLLALTACREKNPPLLIITATPENPPLTVAQEVTVQITPDAPAEADTTATPVLASPEAPITPCVQASAEVPRTFYHADILLDWEAHTAEVEAEVTYTNITGRPLRELVLHVEANRQPGIFTLGDADGEPKLDATRLTVPLEDGLGENCEITLSLDYTLNIPHVEEGYNGRFGYLGYTDRQLNLGHWMPTIALYRDDWYIPSPYWVGEQTLVEASDFEATLEIQNAPPTIDVAAPGIVRHPTSTSWEARLDRARDLTFSVGNGFRRTNGLAEDGTAVEIYDFPQGGGVDPAQQALKAASEAITLYTELFGISYPYPRMVIVEGDFPDGMEFSGLVFVGEAWFRIWNGEPNSWLTVITVHEVAHQWWYGLIGNDASQNPFLDEAFATYSEYLYFQRYYGDQTEWWWDFRVRPYDTDSGVVDAPVYIYPDSRVYINATYLKGAEMLHALRLEMGDEDFFAWIKTYTNTHEFDIVVPQDFWSALPSEAYGATLPLREQFLGQAELFPSPTPMASATPEETATEAAAAP
jgi:hypothetical protein